MDLKIIIMFVLCSWVYGRMDCFEFEQELTIDSSKPWENQESFNRLKQLEDAMQLDAGRPVVFELSVINQDRTLSGFYLDYKDNKLITIRSPWGGLKLKEGVVFLKKNLLEVSAATLGFGGITSYAVVQYNTINLPKPYMASPADIIDERAVRLAFTQLAKKYHEHCAETQV